MNPEIRKAIETLISAHREWEETREYPRDEQGETIVEGTILETCDTVQAWLEKVSDARKYHLVSLADAPDAFPIVLSWTDGDPMGEIALKLSSVRRSCLVIEVDPAGEIEVKPV